MSEERNIFSKEDRARLLAYKMRIQGGKTAPVSETNFTPETDIPLLYQLLRESIRNHPNTVITRVSEKDGTVQRRKLTLPSTPPFDGTIDFLDRSHGFPDEPIDISYIQSNENGTVVDAYFLDSKGGFGLSKNSTSNDGKVTRKRIFPAQIGEPPVSEDIIKKEFEKLSQLVNPIVNSVSSQIPHTRS